MSSRSRERIETAARELGAHPFVHDAADVADAAELVHRVTETLGPVDILIVNSGGPPASPDAFSFTLEQWRAAYELLLLGAVALVEAALPGMRERGWGRVLSLSSSVVREPSSVLVLSASHRAGLLAAMKTFASLVAADGVTVNTLLPGVIATDRARELGADGPERIAQIPAGRLGTVEEFGAAGASCARKPPPTSRERRCSSTVVHPERSDAAVRSRRRRPSLPAARHQSVLDTA